MKRLAIGVGLLVIMLPLGIWVSGQFSAVYNPMAEFLEQAGAAAQGGNWDAAAEGLAQAKTLWGQWHHFSAAVADHEPLEEMEGIFGELERCLQLRSTAKFAILCRKLSALARAMAESQSISWWALL